MSQIAVDKVIPQSGTNLQIGESGDTVNLSTATVNLPRGAGGTAWQAVKTANFTAVAGEGYFVNTTGGVITATLPASATIGNEVSIIDYAGTADTNNITIGRNGHKIQGASSDMTVATERAAFTLVYADATQGWLLTEK